MTHPSTTQRKLGTRAMSWKKIANPKLNRVRASYTESDKPSTIYLIQIIPKTKKQPSNTKKSIVVAVSVDNLCRSALRYLSTGSLLR